MGIRISCPNGHKLNVKTFLAGKRGVCPQCGAKFVIPELGESADSDATPFDGAGQSHSIEVIAPPTSQRTSVVASPSIIISVADSAISTGPPAPQPVPVTAPVESISNDLPPSLVALAPEQSTAANAAVAAPQAQYVGRRKRSRRNQIILSVVLFVVVIVLAVVLVMVLKQRVNQTTDGRVKGASYLFANYFKGQFSEF